MTVAHLQHTGTAFDLTCERENILLLNYLLLHLCTINAHKNKMDYWKLRLYALEVPQNLVYLTVRCVCPMCFKFYISHQN